jgi:hypothetical protein
MRHMSALQRLVEAQQSMGATTLAHAARRALSTSFSCRATASSSSMRRHCVLDANSAARQIFDVAADQLIGRAFPFGVTAAGTRTLEAMVNTARSAGETRRCDRLSITG